LTNDGWHQMLNFYQDSTKTVESDSTATDLLWFFAPDYEQHGKMDEIKNITINGTVAWTQNEK
jgi:hypothetical protein